MNSILFVESIDIPIRTSRDYPSRSYYTNFLYPLQKYTVTERKPVINERLK